MQEIVEKRTLRSKTYDIGGGSFTTDIFNSDVHFYDSQNNLVDVDISYEEKGTYWQMTKGNYRLFVAKDFAANQLIRFDNRFNGTNHTIYYEPKMLAWVNNPDLSDMQVFRNQQSVQGVLEDNKIRWTDAFGDGIHFEVTLRASGFKKEVVIDAKNKLELPPTAQHKLVALFRYQGDGLKILKKNAQEWNKEDYFDSEDGFEFEDASARKSFIRPAYIKDSNPAKNLERINVFWKRHNGSLWQAKVLPKQYLLNATYPVRADTTTDYSATSGGDGDITSGPSSFATARSGTSLTVDKTDNDGNVYTDAAIYIRRLFFPFDTSGIDDGATIDSASLTLTHPHINYNLGNSLSVGLIKSSQASGTNLTTSDWTPSSFSRIASDKAMTSISSSGANSQHTFTLTDLTVISKTGYTFIAALTNKDIDNDSTGITTSNYVDWYFNEEATSSRRPKLTVTYTGGGGGPTFKPRIYFY